MQKLLLMKSTARNSRRIDTALTRHDAFITGVDATPIADAVMLESAYHVFLGFNVY